MRHTVRIPTSERFTWVAASHLSLLALVALIMPLLAAVVDHHAAERLAGHSHIFVGQFNVAHVHGSLEAHAHSGAREGPGGFASVFDTGDAMGATVCVIGIADYVDPLADLRNVPLRKAHYADVLTPVGRSISPIEEPPEA